MVARNTATPDVSQGLTPDLMRALGEGIAANLGSKAGGGWQQPADYYRSGNQFQLGARHTSPAGSPAVGRYAHGDTGVFTLPGVAPDVYSTIVGTMGISSLMPATPSVETTPLFDIITGQQDESGDEPTDVCDDAPIAGLLKVCTQTSIFGRYSRMTPEIDIGRGGNRVNRGDPMDLRAVNAPIQIGANQVIQGPSNAAGRTLDNAINTEMGKILYEFAVTFHRLLARQVWDGNPINNLGTGRRELTGISLLVGTGKVDAETGTACPSVDSDVKDFNFLAIDANGDDFVNAITYLYRQLRSNSMRMGLDPTTWVIAMREELFYEATAVWPCSYLTYRCDFQDPATNNIRLNVDSAAQIAFRDSMRNGRFLTIDGTDVPVVFDDGISEDSNATNGNLNQGQFASDIYFLPMSVLGGRSPFFFEYFDFANSDINDIRRQLAPDGSFEVTNGGAYLWHFKPPLNRCLQAIAWVEPRIILRTPFLAGRLNNVTYAPLQHTRQPFPNDAYFVDGGKTDRPAPSFFNEWQL